MLEKISSLLYLPAASPSFALPSTS